MKGKATHSPNVKIKKEQRSRWKKKAKEETGKEIEETKTLDLMTMLEKNGCHLKPKESELKRSKLSPSLADIAKDPIGLGYFMEFLDCQEMRQFLDFYMAASAFCVASQHRLQHRKTSFVGSHGNPHVATEESEMQRRVPHTMSAPDLYSNRGKSSSSEQDLQKSAAVNGHISATFGKESQGAERLCDTNYSLGYGMDSPQRSVEFCDSWQPFSITDDGPRLNSSHSDIDQGYRRHSRQRTGTIIMDAVTIYTRYISLDADYPIGVTSDVRRTIEAEICKDRDKVDPSCFEEAYEVAKKRLEELQRTFMHSRLGHIYQWQIVQSNSLKLEDVLYNNSSLFYFMEFLDQKGLRAVLEFWLMAENFHQNISQKTESEKLNVEEAVEDAMALYEKYFSMQSVERLITDDKLRIVLENNICREEGPQPTCFAIPVAYAWTALKEILFPQFLQSDVYKKYLESLLKSSTREQKSDENASLSSESMSGSSNVLSSTGENDVDFLDRNLDALWYRPAAGRLALGHVDDFGNFVAETEPEPDQDVSKLNKAMKKMLRRKGVSKEKEKEKEALERARQIIEDIQRSNR